MLAGERITLSPVETEDLPYIVEWRNQCGIRRQFFDKTLISRGGQTAWYEQYLRDKSRQLFIARQRADGGRVGMIGLSGIDTAHHKAEIGSTMIGSRQAWGQGLGSEMVRLVLEYAFSDLNMNRLYAYALQHNAGSIRVKEKCGFRVEGVLRGAHYENGAFSDVVVMGLLRREWLAMRNNGRMQ